MDRPGALSGLRATLARYARTHLGDARRWCVALSGGPDSLALTAAAAPVLPTAALIVDHGLQASSTRVAEAAREQAMHLGCVEAQVITVSVGGVGGPEAAARTARYAALEEARAGAPVLIGHTLDDQAETVLLGLGRGSGPRSISGMRPYDPPWCRPLLGVRRAVTAAVCTELGLTAWRDPHNHDRRFTRSRLRNEVLPLLEDVLGGGVAEALARTATALREDAEVLDADAERALQHASAGPGGRRAAELDAGVLAALPAALRRRAIRSWLAAGGAAGLTDKQIRAVDALTSDWHGQGGVAVGGRLAHTRLIAERRDGRLRLRTEPV
ncbi:tRNA lysidine(34) synthetase TilS [Mycolicibacterium palauense]|uniref:tRNA lysidine(34) synthetase TilS n=1 Tax=Mycolicibacterium palauense TaxID=2034511 RepID=UPI000BFEBF55|nr:tRNA lysidine(34) synthetase TilS [Mycolicibacterium palauense]